MKETLAAAHSQFLEVERELNAAKDREQRAVHKYQSWANGWLFRRLFKKHFFVIGARAKEAIDEREQLDEMLEQSRVDTHFDMPDEVLHAYERLVEAFEGCMNSKRIWDNVAYRQTNRVAERTAATRVVDLKPVTFRKGQCGVINAEMTAPRLQNVTSGDLYLYPGFLVYMVSESTYALVELTEVTMEVTTDSEHNLPLAPNLLQRDFTAEAPDLKWTSDIIFGDSKTCTIIGAALSTVLLGLTLYFREAMLGEQAQKHTVVASKLWGVREALLSLLVDMHDGRDETKVRAERDSLNGLLEEIYKGAPRTDSKAYAAAQKALKADEELFFSDAELDRMLPKRLRSGKQSSH